MNTYDAPGDPFEAAAAAAAAEGGAVEDCQDSRYNSAAINALQRETSGRMLNSTLEKLTREAKQEAERTRGRVDMNAVERAARKSLPSNPHWSDLDELALRRCAAWIIHADGYGAGVTEAEARELACRNPDRVAAGARAITRRLSELMASPPEIDGALVGAHPLLAEWTRKDS